MSPVLFGECVNARATTQVRISALASSGCDLEIEVPSGVLDADFSLWIGAVGPFPARARRKDAHRMAAYFKEPLDRRILQHFNI